MDRSLARSGSRLRASRVADNQRALEDASVLAASRSSSTSPEDRGREILRRLLQQITEFLERKEMMSSRVAASKEWRQSRSRRRSESSSNNLFEVVIQVCEQRMRRLRRSSSGSYGGRDQEDQSPRTLVAEAIVQELLVSLMELRMKEKETLVMNEVENVEIMRQLHVHLQKDEEMVRTKVCVGAGDEQQLEELQLMLRTDFLEEVAGAGSPQKQQQADSAASNEASLQFAWETIDDQKKEIIRLRAENEELKRLDSGTDATSALRASFFDDEPMKVINLLRSQLSSHHEKNLDILHDHIQRLEKALQSATATSGKTRRAWDGSKSTYDSSRASEREDWLSSLLSRSAIGTDFSRTQVPRKKCDECRKNSASLMGLRSEVKQLRAHASSDEESLLQAEKDRGHLQRENSALSTALLSAKQKQEELRKMIVDLTEEKHQLQNLGDSEQRTSERSIRVLKEQLDALEEQKTHQKQKFDELVSKYDAEVIEKRGLLKQFNELQDTHGKLSQSTNELQELVNRLDDDARRCEKLVEERELSLKELQAQLNSMEHNEESQVTELKEKEKIIADLRAELSSSKLSLENLEVEKRRIAGENERLLQTLDECKRKNQRLEKGFEELKQGKELIANLQQVERGASALQLSELKQMREHLEALKLELKSTKCECTRLENELAEVTKTSNYARIHHNEEMDRMQQELTTMQLKSSALETQIKTFQMEQCTFEASKLENSERMNHLSEELEESKTAMLTWMNNYNTVREDKQKLENDIQGVSEEQYKLQQMVKELQAERKATILAKQSEADCEMELRNEILSLTQQLREMERKRRAMDHENKSLVQLVQTLQARPELQQRAFREMIMTCQRGTERIFCQLSESITATFDKLSVVEGRYRAVRSHMARRQQMNSVKQDGDTSSDESEYPVLPKPTSPQIIVQESDFLNNSGYLSTTQPAWLEVLAPLDAMERADKCDKRDTSQNHNETEPSTTARITVLEKQLNEWKWKYFIRCLGANSSEQDNDAVISQLRESAKLNAQLKKVVQKMKVENRQLWKMHRLGVVLTRRLTRELLENKQAQCFANWKFQTRVQSYEAKLRSSAHNPLRPSFSPTTTMALANCIQLVRKFCEPARKTDKDSTKSSLTHGSDELTGYLVEINSKVASWKIAVDRKIAEYAERNNQLKSVQRRCAELKDLVGLNQRLIEEMERRSAGQQNVMEAAWDFATAYKALSPSARAQVFQSRDFLSASKGIVEGLNSLGLPRSVNKLSQTVGVTRRSSNCKADDRTAPSKKVNFFSASAAPGVTSASSSFSVATTEKSRKRLNDSNIELLEDAVGSLKGAMLKQRNLQLQLKEKERSLCATTKELSKRNMQFLLLRSFLQWKCASQNCARRKARQQPAPARRGPA